MKVLDLNGLTKLVAEMKSRFVSKSTLETDVKDFVDKDYIESLGIKADSAGDPGSLAAYNFEVGDDGHLYINASDGNSQYEIGDNGHLYITV